MTYKEVKTMVASIGLDYAYDHFTDDTDHELPFVCFFFSRSNDLAADNVNYQRIRSLDIELYTDNKSFELEATVESVLNQNELVYTREESWIDSEQMYMVRYSTEIVVTDEIITTEENNNG